MNNRQVAKKNMYNKLLVFFAANESIWAAFTRLVTEIGHFRDLNKTLEKFLEQQQETTTGITADKDEAYSKMVRLTVKSARKARVWAQDNGNAALENVFDIQESDFKVAGDVGESRIADVRNALNDNISGLASYNVLPADITAIDDARDTYHKAAGSPGAAEGKKKVGTEGIALVIEDADKSLDAIDDLLISEYSESHPELVLEYRNDRKMDTVGVHHTRIEAHITYSDGSGNAEGVTLHVVETNKTAVSNIDGEVVTPNMRSGTYHVELSAPHIEPKSLIVKVNRGETVKLILQVVKK